MSDHRDELKADEEGTRQNGPEVKSNTDASETLAKPVPFSWDGVNSKLTIDVEVLETSKGEAHEAAKGDDE